MAKKKAPQIDAFDFEAEPSVQLISETIEKNYMPYAMSVIVSRAIPEIDGFKPSHRKLLYTMYKLGLLTGPRTKSANVVGATMRLHPHGDMAIYETMVRLTRANESLLHPFVDSKGSFGKQYSRNMAFAASRYTEVKLDPICNEIFGGIDKDAVDLVENYDNTTKEPVLLPTSFPNILVSPNSGIAVGMASSICSFNLGEICDGTAALLKNPNTTVEELLDIIKAPDFPGGASLIYNREKLLQIYKTGKGGVRLRARYEVDKANNRITIIQIPYSTVIEDIIDKVTATIKAGGLKEILDIRDEIDVNGFKLAIDIRKGVDPDALMRKLFKTTTLEKDFSCNFTVLIDGAPRLVGVKEILLEWIKFRMSCVKRELTFELNKKKDKLHLLIGLGKILLDIDKAIKIVRETEEEKQVVPRLMEGFDIDEIQAEYIAEIKLRHLNREYILNRIKEIEELQKEIADLEDLVASESRLKRYIIKQLDEIKKKYAKPRKTQLVYEDDIPEIEETVENYNVMSVFTKEGYFKKITLLSLRGNDEQLLKDGDEVIYKKEAQNIDEMLFFSDKQQVYKAKMNDFTPVKASMLGEFIPARLSFDEGEKTVSAIVVSKYAPEYNLIFVFENGKCARVPLGAYETKTNRKKLTSAYSAASPLIAVFLETEPFDLMMINNHDKAIVVNTAKIPLKTTRSTHGVQVFKLTSKQKITDALVDFNDKFTDAQKYKKTKIPATGSLIDERNMSKQQMKIE